MSLILVMPLSPGEGVGLGVPIPTKQLTLSAEELPLGLLKTYSNVGGVVILVSQKRKLQHSNLRSLPQGHTANK